MKRRYIKTLRNSAVIPYSPNQPTSYDDADIPAAERSVPTHAVTVDANARVPFYWGLRGFLVTFALGMYAWYFYGWWPWHFSLVLGLVAGSAVAWFWGMKSYAALWTVETIFNVDLDGDGVVGQPTTELSATIEREDGSIQILRDKFGVEPELILDWAKDAVQGKTIGINAWCGGTKPFNRADYENFLSSLKAMDMAENIGGSRGWELTRRGKHYFSDLIKS